MPNWHHEKMSLPIRWSADDAVEKFSFQALLLNADPVVADLIIGSQVNSCVFEQVDRQQLIADQQSLTELFGLMVLAHYRTRPSDLQMMLDRDDISVVVLRHQRHIVASAWLVNEGDLDEQISSAVYAGQRRLKGHLLPQSLLAHSGINVAGALTYQRIIRIAVHPALQRRGLGRFLVQKISEHAAMNAYDILGVSFAAEQSIINFWQDLDYSVARLGFHKDEVTGGHSIMMLNAISAKGGQILAMTKKRFQKQWPYLLNFQFKRVESALLIQISQLLTGQENSLSAAEQEEVNAFCYRQRGYEFSQISLWHFINHAITQPHFLLLTTLQQQLCVKVVLQQQPWLECAKQLNYAGKSHVITALREAIKQLIKPSLA